jgi:RNA polymerase sigma factor (sigma-70 family)
MLFGHLVGGRSSAQRNTARGCEWVRARAIASTSAMRADVHLIDVDCRAMRLLLDWANNCGKRACCAASPRLSTMHEDSESIDDHDPAQASDTRSVLDRLAGDPGIAWAELVARTESKLRVLAHFRAPRGTWTAEDLFQETWSQALSSFDRFEYRGSGSLQAWLAGILRNKALEARRIDRASTAIESKPASRREIAGRGSRELFDALACSRSSVSGSAKRRELEARVRAVLESLADDEREAILLRVYEGLTFQEAARRVGVDPTTMHYRFERALEACSARLREFAM